MKKITVLIFVAMAALLATADPAAIHYFTVGENDSLRINPVYLNSQANVTFRAHFEGRLDHWYVTLYYPTGLGIYSTVRGSDMDVHYLDSLGRDTVYNASLTFQRNDHLVTSFIPVWGYWDYNGDGIYEPYGTVKWGPADYDNMFSINFTVSSSFRCGTLGIDYLLTSSGDLRGNTIDYYQGYKEVFVYVGYKRGDVDRTETVTLNDVTVLTQYLLTDEGLDEFQLAAADFNQDGLVTLDDVTAISNYLLTQD